MDMEQSYAIFLALSLLWRQHRVALENSLNRFVMIVLLKLYFCVQTWHNNMGDAGKNTVTASKKDFTHVTFKPDLGKFKMSHLNKDIVSLMTRRAYDIAGCTKGVSVYLNGNKLPVS